MCSSPKTSDIICWISPCSNKDNSTPVVIVCRAGMSTAQAFEHSLESCVRGFHVYKDVWTPVLNECLQTSRSLETRKTDIP